MENNIDKKIQAISIKHLSDDESNQMWERINAEMGRSAPTVGFLSILIHKPMIQIALIFMLLFGGSVATVAAANNAKPGDLLFPLDRAIENVQIKIVPEDKKDELKVKFALERAEEMEDVILESLDSTELTSEQPVTSTTTDDIATTTDDIVKVDRVKIEKVYATAFDYAEQVKQELLDNGNEQAAKSIDDIINRLNLSLNELPDNLKLEIEKDSDDNKLKIEVKNKDSEEKLKFEVDGEKSEYENKNADGNKVKIKVEDDGRVKVEYNKKDVDDSDQDNATDKKDNSHNTGLSEANVKIYQGKTVIEVEFNDSKSVITTNLSNRSDIIDLLVEKFDVSAEDVDSVLKIEYKNISDDKQEQDDDLLDDSITDNNIEDMLVLKKVEAESDGDGMKIKVKFEDIEVEFFIEDKTREAVIDFVADKYGLDKDDVDDKLQFEL